MRAVRVFYFSLLFIVAAASSWLYFLRSSSSDGQGMPALHRVHEQMAAGLGASAASLYQDPVLDQNFPDPAVIEVDGFFYAFATNSHGSNIMAARSPDLLQWTLLPDALPELAPWVMPRRNQVWAPEVIGVDGRYLMYYTARDRASNRQCIGVATSATPEGPYRDSAAGPLVCPPGFQLAIDANPFRVGEDFYLYFNGVCCDRPNGIFVLKLAPDGLSTAAEPVRLIEAGAPWEGSVAEAPTMLDHDGRLYLFYSGNNYRDDTYAVGYALCESPIGPCQKARENPVLATGFSGSRALGPGHQSIIKVGREFWMLYHGWNGVTGYQNGGRRALWLQPLGWNNGVPYVGLEVETRR